MFDYIYYINSINLTMVVWLSNTMSINTWLIQNQEA